MALSTTERKPTTIYGIDPELWVEFRAWCVARRRVTGDEVNRALRLVMAAPESSVRQDPED